MLPPPRTALTRHYTSLQEHANLLLEKKPLAEDGGLTPRQAGRREGFTWSARPNVEEQPRPSRNPLPPEQPRANSPPPLEEIMRRNTINDADDVQNSKLQHVDSIGSQPFTGHQSRSFSSSTTDSLPPQNRRSSIAAFAMGIARHVPDMRVFAPPEKVGWSTENQHEGDSQYAASIDVSKNHRMSLALPSAMKTRGSYEKAPKPPVVFEEPAPPERNARIESLAAKGGLRDRRKVKLDLAMPTEMPDLPARNRSPIGTLTSLGPSRPRSPKTPWIRDEQPKWEPVALTKSTTIIEEEYIRNSITADGITADSITAEGITADGGLGLLPRTDVLFSSEFTKIERLPQKVKDRCYISRPRFPRSRSGRSGTSESSQTQTPDGSSTGGDSKVVLEQQARTAQELRQLSQDAKEVRSRRWGWKTKTSSEDTPQSPGLTTRRFSINPFKRSNRISDQNYEKDKKQTITNGLGRTKQPLLSLMPIPPEVTRVPTPPIFDANGEVKVKLADFFFDVQSGAGGAPRRKLKTSPGGYWDSDALLMSLTTDVDADDDEEEEGPEGPRTPQLDFDLNGTPGLKATGPSASGPTYLNTQPMNPGTQFQTLLLEPDSWFRIQHSEMIITPDERTRQEEEERRKFEWLVPEHLPTSPLCPLHPKYRSPSFGYCYWHGRRSKGGKVREGEYGRGDRGSKGSIENFVEEMQRGGKGRRRTRGRTRGRERERGGRSGSGSGSRGWESKKVGTPTTEERRRRLVSFSSP
ncbi:hypothetical protein EJ02DRAFT_346200 [Clathrospora elynae]|uniref:Uncharacterized protein n=1 Tax=Clathrospora elynae TaxID=706981 RepID=A0A6A5SNC1_9PLEO|nr:hypothetical protein EJ02DRAFT_346200 [Clathrospora elynae]